MNTAAIHTAIATGIITRADFLAICEALAHVDNRLLQASLGLGKEARFNMRMSSACCFRGKQQVALFEMTKLISNHLQ